MRIDHTIIDRMYEAARVDKAALYGALREYGITGIHQDYPKLRSEWSPANPTRGYCYVVCQFVSLLPTTPAGVVPSALKIVGEEADHWFLRWPDGRVIDLTAEQFGEDYDRNVDYAKGRPVKFRKDKRRAVEVTRFYRKRIFARAEELPSAFAVEFF